MKTRRFLAAVPWLALLLLAVAAVILSQSERSGAPPQDARSGQSLGPLLTASSGDTPERVGGPLATKPASVPASGCDIPANLPPKLRIHQLTVEAPKWAVGFGREFWRRPMPGMVSVPRKAGDTDAPLPASLNLGDVIERVHHALAPGTNDAEPFPHLLAQTYMARFDGEGLRFSPHRPQTTPQPDPVTEARLRTYSVSRDGAVLFESSNPKSQIPPLWSVLGNTAQALLNAEAGLIEHYETREEGVAVTWVVGRTPPGKGPLVVEAELGGLTYAGQTEQGHHYADAAGTPRVRVGSVTVVDASGHRWDAATTAEGPRLRVTVPEAILAQAAYPLAVDPVIGPEFGMDGPLVVPMPDRQLTPDIAYNGSFYLVVWHYDTSRLVNGMFPGIRGAFVLPNGQLADPRSFQISGNIRPISVSLYPLSPRVAASGLDFLVVWGEGAFVNEDPDIHELRAARVTVFGDTPDGPAGRVVATRQDDKATDPAVAGNGSGWLVVWEGTGDQVIGARVDWDGNVVPLNTPLGPVQLGRQYRPAVTANGNNYLVVYEHIFSQPPNLSYIIGNMVTGDGVVIPHGVVSGQLVSAPQMHPAVSRFGDGYLVVWTYYTTPYGIYGMRLDSGGLRTAFDPFPICTAAGAKEIPRIASAGDQALVVWRDSRNAGGDSDVYGARINHQGQVLDPAGFPITTTPGWQEVSGLASDGNAYLCAWSQDTANDTSQIRASVVTKSAAVVHPPDGFLVSERRFNEYRPAVAFNSAEYLAVWADFREVGSEGMSFPQASVYGIRVSAEGQPLTPNGVLIARTDTEWTHPVIAVAAGLKPPLAPSWMVAWMDGPMSLRWTRVNPNGQPMGLREIVLPVVPLFRLPEPTLACNGQNFLLTWQNPIVGRETSLHATHLDPDGAMLETPFSIPAKAWTGYAPAVASDGEEYLVVWNRWNGSDGSSGIYGAKVPGAGSAVGNVLPIAPYPNSVGGVPAAAWDGTQYLVVWEDTRNETAGSTDIYGTRVNREGTVRDSAGQGFPVGRAAGAQTAPAVSGADGEFLVAWQDGRNSANSGLDIYGTRVRDGSVVDGTGLAINAGLGDQTVPEVAAGGLGRYLVVSEGPGVFVRRVVGNRVAPLPPSITEQPQSLTVMVGQSATFSATASGGQPLTYQWRFKALGQSVWVNLPSATARTYTRVNCQFADAGEYSVVVANTDGSITSDAAVLGVFDAGGGRVITPADAGPGSLRAAILSANASLTPSLIVIDPAAGLLTLNLQSPLPSIQTPVWIDGRRLLPGGGGAEDGFIPAGISTLVPGLVLDGAAAGAGAHGLVVQSSNCAVRGVVVHNFSGHGILLSNASGCLLEGNYIGADATGQTRMANGGDGIRVQDASNNRIGGPNGSGNWVAYNTAGVTVAGPHATNNSIRFNSIHSNGALGIDLDPSGLTPNDLGDGDSGPNRLQDFPLVTLIMLGPGSLAIQGTLDSRPLISYTVDFYANVVCDTSGYGEGQTHLGWGTVTTDASGHAAFDLTLPVVLQGAPRLTATATDPVGNTSEFSPCVEATTYYADFNAGLPPGATLASADQAPGPTVSGGVLRMTEANGNQNNFLFLETFGGHEPVTSFTAGFRVRLSDPSAGGPADGFSLSFGPDISNAPFIGEEGTGSGLRISFDTWDNGLPGDFDAPAIEVFHDNQRRATVSMAGTRVGNRAPAGPIPFDPATGQPMTIPTGNEWAAVQIDLEAGGTMDVTYKGVKVMNNLQTYYVPTAGRFALGARTGGAWTTHYIDELRLTVRHGETPQPLAVQNLNDSGPGSLRDALSGAATGGTITFAPSVRGTIVLTSGELLVIDKDLTLLGPGANRLSLQSTNSRILRIASGRVRIAGLRLAGATFGARGLGTFNPTENGGAGLDAEGGGILNFGDLALTDCMIMGCRAGGGWGGTGGPNFGILAPGTGGPGGAGRGGGVCNRGRLTLLRCSFVDNLCYGGQGGTGGEDGHTGSTPGGLGGHGGAATGGALYNAGTLLATNCTFAANHVLAGNGGRGGYGIPGGGKGGDGGTAFGAGYFERATGTLVSCSFTANRGVPGSLGLGGPGSSLAGGNGWDGTAAGGGLYSETALPQLYVRNTLSAGNTAKMGADAIGAAVSGGFNFIGTVNDGEARYASAVQADGPIAYWRFNDGVSTPGSGLAMNSGSLGPAANGTYLGTAFDGSEAPRPPTLPGFEPGNTALQLDGMSAYVRTVQGLMNDRPVYTVSGWMRRAGPQLERTGLWGQDGLLEFGYIDNSTIQAWTDGGLNVPPNPLPNGQWAHLAVVSDGSTLTISTNGRPAVSRAHSLPPNNSFPFNIGGGGIFDPTGNFFNGQIDEVALFDKPLSTEQIGRHYSFAVAVNPFTQPTDQVGLWPVVLDAHLGPLDYFGGTTLVQSLFANSPAIDKGHASGTVTDQRGLARPADQPSIANVSGGEGSDIGAYESELPPRLSIRLGVAVGGGPTVILIWPYPAIGYVLQQSANMSGPGGGWTEVTQAPVVVGPNQQVTLPLTGQFCLFRLGRP